MLASLRGKIVVRWQFILDQAKPVVEGKTKIDVVILHFANAVTRSSTCRAGSTFHLCVGDAEVAGPSVFVRQRKKAQHPSRFERHL